MLSKLLKPFRFWEETSYVIVTMAIAGEFSVDNIASLCRHMVMRCAANKLGVSYINLLGELVHPGMVPYAFPDHFATNNLVFRSKSTQSLRCVNIYI